MRVKDIKRHVGLRRFFGLALCGVLATSAGCYVGLDGRAWQGGEDDDGDPNDDDGDGDSDDPNDDVGPDGQLCRSHESPLRRLTNRQYINTLESLFPGNDFSGVVSLLPADAARHGFENAAELQVPSAALIEGYQRTAVEVTNTVFPDGAQLTAVTGYEMPASRDGAGVIAEQLIADYGRRIFRRPLELAELERYGAIFSTAFAPTEDSSTVQEDFLVAFSITLQALLQSPNFVYVIEHGEGEAEAAAGSRVRLTSWEVASRLSYFVWDSMPDDILFAAAEADALRSADDVEEQVRRMLEDPRARPAIANFHRQWLGFDDVLSQMKDPGTYPEWSGAVSNSSHEQLLRFAEHAFFEGEGTVAELLTSSQIPVDANLAGLMGVAAPPEGEWHVIDVDPAQRRGVLTLPGFLAGQSHPVNPSPVLRGEFVRNHVLCSPIPPPPDDVDSNPPEEGDEPITNRQRYDQFLENSDCSSCHTLMHGIGYPFEAYDSTGAFRTTDNGQPVDTRGELIAINGMENTEVSSAVEMVELLANTQSTHSCVATQMFRNGFGRDPEGAGGDSCTTDDLTQILVESQGDLRELIVELATSSDFRRRRIPEDA